MLFAYLGPDTFLPLTSVIAAVVGGFLMFGRNVTALVRGFLRRAMQSITARDQGPAASGRRRSARLRGEEAPGTSATGHAPHVRPGLTAEGESLPSSSAK